MNIEFDEDLLEGNDEQDDENDSLLVIPPNKLDARRMIERRIEMKRLREMLDDPEFDDIFEESGG
jgi:hypothetical protein